MFVFLCSNIYLDYLCDVHFLLTHKDSLISVHTHKWLSNKVIRGNLKALFLNIWSIVRWAQSLKQGQLCHPVSLPQLYQAMTFLLGLICNFSSYYDLGAPNSAQRHMRLRMQLSWQSTLEALGTSTAPQKTGMVVHKYNLSTGEVEARSSSIWSQSGSTWDHDPKQ